MKTTLTLSLLGLAASTFAPAAESSYIPLKIEQTLLPMFPAHLSWRGITQGQASIAIAIDETGKVTDLMPLAYTKRAFADEAIRVLKNWRYQPMRLDGQAHPGMTELHFTFEAQGVVVQRSADEMVAAFIDSSFDRQEWELAPCNMKNLDRIPTPITMVSPLYPFVEGGIEGRVTIEFIIDREGNVRFPHLRGKSADALSGAALDAVRQWKFAPPTEKGTPVIVRASQEFVFVAKKTK
ncbi:MAG: energy transducer TonB [Opitutaceae bacterium]|nr:energy transducer TonB [Opitutaceae bacterium]